MANTILFFVNSVMLGLGLAMDAFSVSLANGFADTKMSRRRRLEISGVYAVFQFIMPFIGWFLVHNAANIFSGLNVLIPWIALFLLAFIGGKMLIEGWRERKCYSGKNCKDCKNTECVNKDPSSFSKTLSNKTLMIQGIATSIDALSVGFTISQYGVLMVLVCVAIIGAVTWVVCYVGLKLGIKFGTKLAGNAKIVGGLILIGIGLEIFFG
ncbi:MAG: manganese efflux pump [Butyrivibrio sp.]|nr:manganese efflux pump [Butyrivibrio sp.]MBR4639760.1 manganese efflux pump [Butyrivibrio sp.]